MKAAPCAFFATFKILPFCPRGQTTSFGFGVVAMKSDHVARRRDRRKNDDTWELNEPTATRDSTSV